MKYELYAEAGVVEDGGMMKLWVAGLVLGVGVAAGAQGTVTAAISTDPPADKAAPAAIESFQLPSHGALLNALVYEAAGAGPHPVAVLLHGFPGNEKNLDLAQALRRAGWDVLYFNYRGSWGSPGVFSFAHSLEDSLAAVAYMRDPANAKRLRADPAKIVVIGHSMGGWMALATLANDPEVRAAVMISAADMGGGGYLMKHAPDEAAAVAQGAVRLAREGIAPLAGCTAAGLAQELADHGNEWPFAVYLPRVATRKLLMVSSDDGNQPSADKLAERLRMDDAKDVKQVHIATDHVYSGKRIELETAVLGYLGSLGLE